MRRTVNHTICPCGWVSGQDRGYSGGPIRELVDHHEAAHSVRISPVRDDGRDELGRYARRVAS